MSDSLLRQTARARPRKVPRRLSGTTYARATNTHNLFVVMTVVAVAFFFLLASTLHGSGLEAAERGDNSVIETLQQLFMRPYSDDHDPRLVEKYARRAPDGAHTQGGVGYMS